MRIAPTAFLLITLSAATLRAQRACTAIGKDRWDVKTLAPATATHAKSISLEKLATLPPPQVVVAKVKGAKTSESRYEGVINGFREGDLVTVSGWVRFIRLSSDDCDYHIQLTPSLDSDTGMVIVEIPEGDAAHVKDAALREELAKARDEMTSDLKLPRPPGTGGSTIGKAYMNVSGALFFDAWHYPNCSSRGVHMQASTCWEVHPVVDARFTPVPQHNP